jgi:hypothetical protein
MKRKLTYLQMGAMLLLAISAHTQNGLFISEVTDPADEYSGRFIELYNGGTETVDFSTTTFYLSRQSNGGTGWGNLLLEGSVAPGEIFVIGGSSFEAIYGFAPDMVTGILIGNGDDAYFLYTNGDYTTGTLYDIYGALDVDGTGEPWEYEDSRAVRVVGVNAPTPLWSAAEWKITPADIADCDPGVHHNSGGGEEPPPPGEFAISLQNDTVSVGQPAEVLVMVSEITADDQVISWQFDLAFDDAVLEYVGYDISGTIAAGGTLEVNTGVAGQLSMSYMNSTPLTGSGEIVRVQFNTLTTDTTEVSLSNVWMNNWTVEELTNGTVIVVDAEPPSAALTYSASSNRFADTLEVTAAFNKRMDPANAVQLYMTGTVTHTAEMTRVNDTLYTYHFPVPKADGEVTVALGNGTDLWGNEVEAVPVSGSTFYIIRFMAGDVDDDGLILAYDAALVLQHSVGLDPLAEVDPLPWENWRDSTANVDGGGGITAYDAALILQYSAGIITDFSGGGKKSAAVGDVTVEIEGRELVFYAHGELLGFNLFTENTYGALGDPVFLAGGEERQDSEGALSAVNIRETTYSIGFCSAVSPLDGAPLLKIPVQQSGSLTFRMLVNREEKDVTVRMPTGLADGGSAGFVVYPNPARDQLFIQPGEFGRTVGSRMKVVNQLGVVVFEGPIEGKEFMIDLSNWPGAGTYYLQLTDSEGAAVALRKIMLQ